VGGVLATENIHGSGGELQGFHLGIPALKKFCHTIIIRIAVAAEIAAVNEVTAFVGRLQQNGGSEFTAVEMPIQRFTIAVSHDVQTREGIAHGKQGFLLHGGCKKNNEAWPFINPSWNAVWDLVVTDGVIDCLRHAQCRMISTQACNLLFEIDIVQALVGE
jgi:hypothetical protein